MTTIEAESTPNPNSIKFTTTSGRFRDDGVAAFSSPEDARDHSLARHLFSIRGVEDVFITPDFVTVSKQSGADWEDAVPKIKSALADHLAETPSTSEN